MTPEDLVRLCGGTFDLAEAEARIARLTDPRFASAIVEVEAVIGPETAIVDVQEVDGIAQVSVLPFERHPMTIKSRATGYTMQTEWMEEAEDRKRSMVRANLESMRERVALFETGKVRGRPEQSALRLLVARGLYSPDLFWPALNPHRYEELARRRVAIELMVAQETEEAANGNG